MFNINPKISILKYYMPNSWYNNFSASVLGFYY